MEQNKLESDRDRLVELKKQLGRLHHDLQSPLSILTGNVELVQALSADMELDESITQSLTDIHAASLQLGTILNRLTQLRESIDE